MTSSWRWFWGLAVALPLGAFVGWGLADNTKLFLTTTLNGLTLGALSGKVVAEQMLGKHPDVDIAAFSIVRFARA